MPTTYICPSSRKSYSHKDVPRVLPTILKCSFFSFFLYRSVSFVQVVVGVNVFSTDTPAEIELVKELAVEAGAFSAVKSSHW